MVKKRGIGLKPIILGILAHVDTGKTSLIEALLYACKQLKQLGRVDHGTAFLDNDHQEKERGITIFSKEVILPKQRFEYTILDTPGHVDFSAEMERTLQVLDYAVLMISATDGVQAHSETIWRLLKHYQIPVFVYINKMDMAFQSKTEIMKELKQRLCVSCVDFTQAETDFQEEIALFDEEWLDSYLTRGYVEDALIQTAIKERNIFPCFFGSAKTMEGITSLIQGWERFMKACEYPKENSAFVYKISHDEQGNRLTHVKITGGTLLSKTKWKDEKIDQIRRYHGTNYQLVQELSAGHVCALKGLHSIQIKETIGSEPNVKTPILSSNMRYQMLLPTNCDAFAFMKQLKSLQEEDPSLHLTYDEHKKAIFIQVRGEIQMEILRNLIDERYHVQVHFDDGNISYRETVVTPVEGVGHYEPLRHYAEVHLLLEPLPPNSGIVFASKCPSDVLDTHIQRTILSTLAQEELVGVLSGSLLTDMKITLLSGKAHEKHTSGGDFREAAKRALRQGLKAGNAILLEPYERYRLEVPTMYSSRAFYDVERMGSEDVTQEERDGYTFIYAKAPSLQLKSYALSLASYTKGKGRFYAVMEGFYPVKHQEKHLAHIDYDSEKDLAHPTGSIFCIHGAGTYVKWDEVANWMHLPYTYGVKQAQITPIHVHRPIKIDDAELKRVTQKLHQPRKIWSERKANKTNAPDTSHTMKKQTCLLVDGYNMIFHFPKLKEIAKQDIAHARSALISMISSYEGYRNETCIIVFDAYKTEQNKEQIYKDHQIYIVYTKQAQTADSYIEKATKTLADQYHVIVATSDKEEQNIILGQGAYRMSARELYQQMETTHHQAMIDQNIQPQFRHMALEELRKFNETEEND